MNWKILAWDDQPMEYMEDLRARLVRRKIEFILEQDIESCWHRFSEDPSGWDCVILDVVDASTPDNPDRTAGARLARKIRERRSDIPLVFLTTDANGFLGVGGDDLKPPTIVRHKSYTAQFMAMDVVALLESRPRRDRVFLIYGRNRASANIKEEVQLAINDGQRIIGPGVQCVTLEPQQAVSSISESLQVLIRDCGAVVALCTPDDKLDDAGYQPRQNVLLEMGMTLGLSDGFRRLVILQRWGEDVKNQARLPSDLGGALTIRFFDDHDGPIEQMLRALRDRGVVSPKP